MIIKILRLFVNTFTVDEKHFLLTRDNLTQTIKLQLSQKQKKICGFIFVFLNSISNYKHLSKKKDPDSSGISGKTGYKKCG